MRPDTRSHTPTVNCFHPKSALFTPVNPVAFGDDTMTSYDEMDITSWLQSEGRRLAGPCARGASRPGGGGQQQASCFDSEPSAPLAARIEPAPVPGSLSEVLLRMELEKQSIAGSR